MINLEYVNNKIFKDCESFNKTLAFWRFKDYKIVFTNGCFDIIHRGHIDYLSKAKDLGSKLIIGLNTDSSVHALKGDNRPINDEYSRALLLASFGFVDAIIFFGEETPYELIKFVKPDVLVKGSDYEEQDIVGYDIVTNKGGKVKTLNFIDGFSSTSIIERIKEVK